MILQWFAEMIYKLLTGLLSFINLPSFSEEGVNAFGDYIELIILNGISIAEFFIPSSLFKVGIPIVLAITAFKYGYYFVMFILKKIPMANIH